MFVVDERISIAQQSTIETQQSRIVELTEITAPRRLFGAQQKELTNLFAPLSGKTIRISSYALDFEAAWFGAQIEKSLVDARAVVRSFLLCEVPLGNIALAVLVGGDNDVAVRDILLAFQNEGIDASRIQVPPSIMSCPPGKTIPESATPGPIDATIFIGAKKPPL